MIVNWFEESDHLAEALYWALWKEFEPLREHGRFLDTPWSSLPSFSFKDYVAKCRRTKDSIVMRLELRPNEFLEVSHNYDGSSCPAEYSFNTIVCESDRIKLRLML